MYVPPWLVKPVDVTAYGDPTVRTHTRGYGIFTEYGNINFLIYAIYSPGTAHGRREYCGSVYISLGEYVSNDYKTIKHSCQNRDEIV